MNQDAVLERFAQSCVGIAGLGGLGSNVAMALARSGIGRLIIVDYDMVEESNLNRQAYDIEQIGKRKTEALMQNIGRVNPEVDVTAINLKLEPGNMDLPFQEADIIVEALDSSEAKTAFIEEIMVKLPAIPIVAASGVAGIGRGEKISQRISGNLYLVEDDGAKPCDVMISLAPRVGIFACWQANLVLEILAGDGID